MMSKPISTRNLIQSPNSSPHRASIDDSPRPDLNDTNEMDPIEPKIDKDIFSEYIYRKKREFDPFFEEGSKSSNGKNDFIAVLNIRKFYKDIEKSNKLYKSSQFQHRKKQVGSFIKNKLKFNIELKSIKPVDPIKDIDPKDITKKKMPFIYNHVKSNRLSYGN